MPLHEAFFNFGIRSNPMKSDPWRVTKEGNALVYQAIKIRNAMLFTQPS
jgi:hypothetical protein